MNMVRYCRTSFFLLVLLSTNSALWAQTIPRSELPEQAFTIALDQEPPLSPDVVSGVLDNGLRYYIRENHEPANRAELRLVVNVGSVLEDDNQIGLAHFLEHMAFNGTEHFEKQELIRFMESIGMRLGPGVNASTSFDETIYQLQLPTDDPAHLEKAIQIMEDWATGMTLDADEIERERGVVIEEWRLGQGAQTRIRDKQMPVILKDSKYARRLPIGTLERLQNFDHEELRRFYREWYRPELIAVIAVGDFDAKAIEALVRQYFESIPASRRPRKRKNFEVPVQNDTQYVIATDPEMPTTQVTVYHKHPARKDWTVGDYRQHLVESLYNAVLSTRFGEMSRQPNPPFLAAFSSQTALVRQQSAYVLAAVVPETGIQRGLETVLVEAERVARHGFSIEEVERQKVSLLRTMEQSYTNRASRSSASLAAELTRSYLTGESVPGLEYEMALLTRFISGVTIEEVNRIGKSWISDRNRVVSVVAPEKAGLTPPTPAELQALIAAVANSDIEARNSETANKPLISSKPKGSPVVSTEEIEGGITHWTLANGVEVFLKPTDFREDEVLFRAFSPGGTSIAADEDFIPASTASIVIANGGLGQFTAVELQRELTGKIASVSPFINDYEEGFEGKGSPRDLELLMQLIHLRTTAPRADTTFFQIFNTQMKAALQNRSANPGTVFEDTFSRLLYQNHPRQQPPSVDMLDHTDLQKSLAFYQDRFSDVSDFTFIFAGSLDPERMKPLVETYLGGLPDSGREENWIDRGVRYPNGVVKETIRRGLEQKGNTRVAFTGPFAIRDRFERPRLLLAGLVLETRLRNLMREQLGGTYNVQVNSNMVWRPVESYRFLITFGSDPARVDELTEVLFREIESIKRDGATAQELADAKQALLRTYESGLKQNSGWVAQILYALYSGVQPLTSEIFSFPESVEAVSLDALRDAFGRYLNRENYIHLTQLPEN